jgi:hypothetical protein
MLNAVNLWAFPCLSLCIHTFPLSPHLLSTTRAHSCYKQCCTERGSCYGVCEDVAGARRTQPPVECLWMFGALFPGFSITLWQSSFFLRDIVSVFTYMSTMCMEFDPSMHIDLHLVFFGKTGVIEFEVFRWNLENAAKVLERYRCQMGLTRVLID